MKRKGHLFEEIVSDKNLSRAIDEVNKSHRWKAGHKPNRTTAWVERTKGDRIKALRRIITNGYTQQKPHIVKRYDVSAKKWRVISEPILWPDQYVHHALIQVIQPIFMRGMDMYCCGSIKGRGTHYAKDAIEGWMRKDPKDTRYCLCCDIYHFYESLEPDVVMDRMRNLIKDGQVLGLIEQIVEKGILIGAYPSQWFANTTLQPLDALIRQSGLCSHYVRYMDNITVFGSNKRKLRRLKRMIGGWLDAHKLRLKGDWQIYPATSTHHPEYRLPDAVGYRYGRGYTLIRKNNLLRTKRIFGKYRKLKRQGRRISPQMAGSMLSRLGQLQHCNNVHIYKTLFKGEKIARELKHIERTYRKELITWSMFLEAESEAARCRNCSKRKDGCPPTCMEGLMS